jgi:hypothetical protein
VIGAVDFLASSAQLETSGLFDRSLGPDNHSVGHGTNDKTLAQHSTARVVQCTEVRQFSSYKSAKVSREAINPCVQLSDFFTRSQSRATLLPEYLAELSHSPLAKLRL